MPTHSIPSFDRSSPFNEKRYPSPRPGFVKSTLDRSDFTTPAEFLRKDSQEKASHWENRAGQHRNMSGSQRYLRYVLFAFLTIAILYFITSSSSTPRIPGSQHLSNAGDILKGSTPDILTGQDSLGNDKAIDEKPAKLKTPSPAPPKIPEPAPAPVPIDGKTSLNPKPHSQTPFPAADAPGPRMNATFVTLARNSDVWEIARSIRQIEDRFNHRYHYDWVFLNDADFDDQFKKITSALTSGNTKYGKITKDHWGFPEWIDQDKARRVREDMKERKIIYGDSVSYRHMCRYESGFFFRHELMLDYEWYWRVEPSVELYCDVAYDPFKYMKDHGKKYSFVISLYEYAETITTLWDSTKKFMTNHPEHIAEDNSMGFLSDDGGKTYNKCHFWSNFEIGSLEWLRSDAYIDFFTSLDHDGGFFYERWGDAPIHSIAAGLMLKKDEIHFFDDIAYYHVPFTHCPTGEQRRLDLKCHCNPSDNFDWKGYSCTKRYFEVNKKELPAGYEKEQ